MMTKRAESTRDINPAQTAQESRLLFYENRQFQKKAFTFLYSEVLYTFFSNSLSHTHHGSSLLTPTAHAGAAILLPANFGVLF